MKKYIVIIISLTLVLTMVTGCGSLGGKKFDNDSGRPSNNDSIDVEDDIDETPDSDEVQTERTGASDTDATETDDTEADDTLTDETGSDESNPATSPGGVDSTVVGIWTNWKDDYVPVLPASYTQKFLSADMTDSAAALALVNEIKGDSAITKSVFVHAYRQDGTGYTFFVATSGYGWCTFNYSVEGDILHVTNRIYTSQDEDPKWTFENKPYDDESNEFRLSVQDGKERLFVMPNISEDNEMSSLTVEEYIEWMHEGEWKIKIG